ncbi:MAG TPA: hypothetical protein EYQ64_02365 [Gemmatimonadetes bacterium]|nr:hypothetical protein [Gemmatimonadota bacterium]
MKRIILAVFGVLTVSVGAEAQNTAMTIERALLAAPARARASATVIDWNADHTYRTLQEGTSQMVCYDRSGDPLRPAFAVACTVLGNLDRVAQNRRFAAEGGDAEGRSRLVAAAEANGSRIAPVFGSPWLGVSGDSQGNARTHTTIAMPGATEANSGFPENGRGGGAFLMAAGTTEAHLMTPYIASP